MPAGGNMISQRCPNCNGTLSLSVDKTHWICDYCGSAFVNSNAITTETIYSISEVYLVQLIDVGSLKYHCIKIVREITGLGLAEATQLVKSTPCTLKQVSTIQEATAIKNQLEAIGAKVQIETDLQQNSQSDSKQLLDCSDIQNLGKTAFKTFEEMCVWIDSGDTVNACLECLAGHAANYSEWALENVHTDLLFTVKNRITHLLSPNERLLFYKDSGIISKGKTGILISDKAIYALKKNYIERILVSDLNSINVYGLGWCFNSNKKIELDNMSCSPELQGVILALICVLARECHAPGYKIKIHK